MHRFDLLDSPPSDLKDMRSHSFPQTKLKLTNRKNRNVAEHSPESSLNLFETD